MDPSMGAPPDIQGMITQAVQQAMGGAPGGAPGAPGAGGAGAKPKIDPTFIYMELSRIRKIQTHLLQHMGIDLPPDILDDGSVAQMMTGAMPESPPIGQESAAPTEGDPAGGGGLPGIGQTAPVSPIEAPKQASEIPFGRAIDNVGARVTAATFDKMNTDLDALAAMARSLNGAA